MSGRSEVYESLDLALRVGELLLSSGAAATDVTATMLAVTSSCGVRHVTADVTFVDLTLRHQPSAEEPAALQIRRLSGAVVDYTAFTNTDRTVNDLVAGRITRSEASAQIAQIVAAEHPRRRWAVSIGWGVMGSGVALTLGGTLLMCLLAFLAAWAIYWTQRPMFRRHTPTFYVQLAGGFVATLVAVLAAAADTDLNPSRVVTAGIVMLLAGVGIMGATQDALTGSPVTASARLLVAVLDTTGIIAGVSAGLTAGRIFGVGLGTIKAGAAGNADLRTTLVGAAVAAAAFGYASYAPARSLLVIALVGALGQGVDFAVGSSTKVGQTWAAALAAVTIGAVCRTGARWFRVPPLVVVIPAVVPLLPGLAIYRGLALLAGGEDGVLQLASAFATALALAAGVILGQYVAHPSGWGPRRLEWRVLRWSGRFASTSGQGRRRQNTTQTPSGPDPTTRGVEHG
ncbi:threonine/serine ThrE exporter family protein [Nocardioides sp. Iso805N]|uniref:threonine/serine ThrE exporter family protein n=1 Tax=Nocardioides sp. Iso805N TaxID=1283287 RepID=UPI00037467DC|nr:threonine/serine exporter family protein [Nocardioides sp. Iso805N]